MRCASCQEPLAETAVFPGGTVTCRACGVAAEIPSGANAPPAQSPYRQPAPDREPAVEPEPAPARASRERKARSDASAIPIPAALGTCPRCPAVALTVRHDEHSCPRCGGLFVPHRRLREIVHEHRASGLRPAPDPDESSSSAPSVDSVTYLRCPECTTFMNRKNFGGHSGIVVDVCKMHGVWFDRGELDAASAFAFDLPADTALRATLLALVGQPDPAAPPAPRRSTPPIAMPLLHVNPHQPLLDIESVESLLAWVGRWFS